MSNVTVKGLLSARRKNVRASVERAHHINNEMQVRHVIREDKAGRCYTYRGVQYCYN